MHRILISLIFLLFCNFCFATNVYVNTDVSGGTGDGSSLANAYSSLHIAYKSKAGVLAEDINFLCYATLGTPDANCVLNGMIVTSYNITVKAMDANYKIVSNNVTAVDIADENVKLEGLVIETTVSTVADGVYLHDVGTCTLIIEGCTITGICSGTGSGYGIRINDSSCTPYVRNSIIKNWKSGFDSGFAGIFIIPSSTMYIYNCTVTGCQYGMYEYSGTIYASNCALFNNDYDFRNIKDANTVSYCASDDGYGVNAVDISPNATEADDWALAFTDYSNGDFSIKDAGSVLYNAGTDLTASGVTTDIIGIARPQATIFDIGAYEFIVAGAPAVKKPRIININMN